MKQSITAKTVVRIGIIMIPLVESFRLEGVLDDELPSSCLVDSPVKLSGGKQAGSDCGKRHYADERHLQSFLNSVLLSGKRRAELSIAIGRSPDAILAR